VQATEGFEEIQDGGGVDEGVVMIGQDDPGVDLVGMAVQNIEQLVAEGGEAVRRSLVFPMRRRCSKQAAVRW
jgi:hypothetical protein